MAAMHRPDDLQHFQSRAAQRLVERGFGTNSVQVQDINYTTASIAGMQTQYELKGAERTVD